MSRYDGLIIPRSYSEYINKTDAATLQHALQLSGVLSGAVAAGDNKAVKSSAVYEALTEYTKKTELRHFHANTINYSEKILIVPNISNYGNYFNGLFTWSSYGNGNYMSLYLLRFSWTEITNTTRLSGNTPADTAEFTIENDDLYFYPNGKGYVIAGGGGAYNFLLS